MAKIVKPVELRTWREVYGYTQKDLAKILGTSPGCIQSWEVGRRTCPPTLYWALKGILASQPAKEPEPTRETNLASQPYQ